MKAQLKTAAALVVLALVVVAMTACEDSDLTAPSDASMLLTGNPQTLVLDPLQGQTQGTIDIQATVFSSGGSALDGVTVLFSTTAGVLSATQAETDSSGIARVSVGLTVNDPAAVVITAQSSSVSEQVTLEVITIGNAAPTAGVVPSPASSALVNQPVLFDGSFSSDPDGDPLTCFQWTFDSSDDTYDEIVQGVAASGVNRTYPVEQVLNVTLRVSDRATVGAQCCDTLSAGCVPVPSASFSKNTGSVTDYRIECSNPPPVANGGPDIRQSIGASSLVRLDGTGSFDNETPIDRYLWACGNGSIPNPRATDPVVFCSYQAVGTYQAELTVWDQGDGTIDPATGNFRCQKRSTDIVTVEIFDPNATP
jgi:hypothetical protein